MPPLSASCDFQKVDNGKKKRLGSNRRHQCRTISFVSLRISSLLDSIRCESSVYLRCKLHSEDGHVSNLVLSGRCFSEATLDFLFEASCFDGIVSLKHHVNENYYELNARTIAVSENVYLQLLVPPNTMSVTKGLCSTCEKAI